MGRKLRVSRAVFVAIRDSSISSPLHSMPSHSLLSSFSHRLISSSSSFLSSHLLPPASSLMQKR